MVTFNYANIRTDDNGKKFLDLEIQAVFQGQKIIIRNSFAATKDYQTCGSQPSHNGLMEEPNHKEESQ